MPEFTNDLTHDDLALLLLLAEKRSLTRSAMTLAWSTPKASHRLNHARALIGDELFVRSGNSLVPTKRMEALVPTMRRALEALEGIFAEERFSPLEIDRTIIFEMVDNAAAVLLAPALPALTERAPKLKIRIRPAAGLTLENLWDGTTNLAFGFDIDRELPGDIQSATLFKSRHVAVMRRGHPLLNHPSVKAGIPVGAKVLAPYPYISISMPQWRSLRNIDLPWRAENPSPVRIETPYFLSMPYLLAQSDAYALLPREGAELLSSHLPLAILETDPADIRGWNPQIIWHRRNNADFALQWVRSEICLWFKKHPPMNPEMMLEDENRHR